MSEWEWTGTGSERLIAFNTGKLGDTPLFVFVFLQGGFNFKRTDAPSIRGGVCSFRKRIAHLEAFRL